MAVACLVGGLLLAAGSPIRDVCALGCVDASAVGTVAGTVTLSAARGQPLATSAYGRRGVAPKPSAVAPETRKVVVYLSGIKASPAASAMRAQVEQRNEQFAPPVTVVTSGSTIDFPNTDPYFHNVFSLSRAATFDLGRYPSGATRSHVFERPGLVKVFCHIHAQMSALVMVLEHSWFTIPAENGKYSLPPAPPGEYTLVAWHDRIGEQRTTVRIAAGSTLRVDFTLPVLESEP
jgi:plastocyanin